MIKIEHRVPALPRERRSPVPRKVGVLRGAQPQREVGGHRSQDGCGTEAARELLADADVFVENFGYCVADNPGLGNHDVREINLGIVYARVDADRWGRLRQVTGFRDGSAPVEVRIGVAVALFEQRVRLP